MRDSHDTGTLAEDLRDQLRTAPDRASDPRVRPLVRAQQADQPVPLLTVLSCLLIRHARVPVMLAGLLRTDVHSDTRRREVSDETRNSGIEPGDVERTGIPRVGD